MAHEPTRRLVSAGVATSDFHTRQRASLVVLEGPGAGEEYELAQAQLTLGRGPGVEIPFPDDAMSRRHALFELGSQGYRIRDLGSTNGIFVNDVRVDAADLEHADRIRLGQHTLQYLLEKRERVGVYDLSEEL